MKTFMSVNTKRITDEIQENEKQKELGRNPFVISVGKYNVSILTTKLSMKNNCH